MVQKQKFENKGLAIGDRDHIRGPANAPVTLVQYGDFECPYCGDLYPVVRRLQNRLGKRLRLVFRHFPLTEQHHRAEKAAEAAEAAAAQGEAYFWQMHDCLYEHQNALTRDDLESYAAELGLDIERFVQELDAGTYENRVREDILSAENNGVTGTPTFFINGERYDGALDFDALLAAIAEAGGLADVRRSLVSDNRALRETIDRSRVGAPAAGGALRDRFSADEIFQRITASAEEEIGRSARLLFFSGLAAGASIGATFFGRAVMTAAFPDDPIGLGNLLYPLGFMIIVIGGYQLFTENTLTPVTLVLTRQASIPRLLRLWGIVLFANVVGAAMVAFFFVNTSILNPPVAAAARSFGEHALSLSWSTLFLRAILAGVLVATMVWLVHAARETTARIVIIWVIMFLIPAGDLFHCVTGAFEMFFLVFEGSASLLEGLAEFFVPVVLGNVVGGVIFVTLINYGMTAERTFPNRNGELPELSWSEWLFGMQTQSSFGEREAQR